MILVAAIAHLTPEVILEHQVQREPSSLVAAGNLSFGREALCVDRLGNHSACNGKQRGTRW